MPLPKPSPNSDGDKAKNAFVSKCMHAMKDEKRPQDQKVAICLDLWRRRKKSKKSKGSSEEPQWEEQIIKDKNGDCFIL